MKKFFYLFVAALVSLTFCSCSSDDDDNNGGSDSGKFTFVAPYMEWDSSLDDVRTYMKINMPDYKEEADPYKSTEGTEYFFHDKSSLIQYSYVIKDGKLVESKINYTDMNKNFNDMKSQVSTKYSITDWTEYPEMSGVKWWAGKNSEKKLSVSIGYGSVSVSSYKYDYM